MKYCTQCGSGNTDEAAFCAQCGNRLESNQVSPSQPEMDSVPEIPPVPDVPRPESFGEKPQHDQPYVPPVQQTPAQQAPTQEVPTQTVYTQPYATPPVVDKGNSVLWLVLNIVLAVLCCCTIFGGLGTLCAIIGIVFAGMAISKYNSGLVDVGKQYEKVAMILFFVALGVAIISIIVVAATGSYSNFDYYSDFFDY